MKKKRFSMKDKFSKGKFEVKKFKNSRPLGKSTNDSSWYYPDTELQRLAAAISMNDKVGNKVALADNLNLKESSDVLDHMPGVFVNPIMHVPGVANSPTDPVNDATRANMNRIREQINANRDYEMPDLGKYLLAIADLFAWVEFLKLIYRICNKFNPLNRYTPTAILRALHIDTSDINNLRIQLAFYIDTLVHKLSNLKVPTEIPIIPTWIEDYKHVFVDEDIAKAQYIVNVPHYVWKYTIDQSTSKSKLITKNFFRQFTFANPASVNDLKLFTEDLMSEILNDEDFAIITGDLLKSYSSFYELTPLNMSDVVEFEYSKEYLEKWHNSCTCAVRDTASITVTDWEIVEDTSTYLDPFLKFDPQFQTSSAGDFTSESRGAGNRMLDFYDREVSPDQIINGTLWMFTYDIVDAATRKYKFHTTGTSVVGNSTIVYYDNNNQLVERPFYGVINMNKTAASVYSIGETFTQAIAQLAKWNYHPIIIWMIVGNTVTATDLGLYAVSGDFGNYTIIDSRILENIDTCILYGQYNINHLLHG